MELNEADLLYDRKRVLWFAPSPSEEVDGTV